MRLPGKPSELIELALRDLAAVEADPRYVVDMLSWHSPLGTTETCAVCLAGAVMARSLGVDRRMGSNPECFRDDDVTAKLMALDAFRRGNVSTALGFMQLRPPPTDAWFRSIVPYEIDPELFKEGMRDLAATLERAGL